MRVSADLVLTQIKRSIVVPAKFTPAKFTPAKFTPAKAREGEERELSTPQDCWGLLDRPAEPVHRAGQRPDPLAADDTVGWQRRGPVLLYLNLVPV
jgi:hypothetical protein